ncbi:cytochrome P450 94A2-like [Senna tora]|uniref:Cytochrome P450 94A2-like n=1 Tax=Senna tora TaxID=362788 RepID=A0A835CEN4_9FABA|nr:cytochrome P450 94A2-like [Senna tora]
MDLLSRFLNSSHSDEDFMVDIMISFILAGRDSGHHFGGSHVVFLAALESTPNAEKRIRKEIEETSRHCCTMKVCLGKEIAFLQMKRIVVGVVRRFKVVPARVETVILIAVAV